MEAGHGSAHLQTQHSEDCHEAEAGLTQTARTSLKTKQKELKLSARHGGAWVQPHGCNHSYVGG